MKFQQFMADKGTDISNAEQLSFCIRTVNDEFNIDEDFIGFHKIDNISDSIVKAIKDILLRCSLCLENCREQTYDGASNMMGNYQVFQPKSVKSNQKQFLFIVKDIPSV